MIFINVNSSESDFKSFEDDVVNKIKSFLKLPKGWHCGEGRPPNRQTAIDALTIYNKAKNFDLNVDVCPGIEGEIEVVCFNNIDTLEFTINERGSVDYVLEKLDQEIECEENISFITAINKLDTYGEEISDTIFDLNIDVRPGIEGETQMVSVNSIGTLGFIINGRPDTYGGETWNILGSYTQGTTNQEKKDLVARHLNIPPMGAEYPLLTSPAY